MDYGKRLGYMAEIDAKVASGDAASAKMLRDTGRHTARERMNMLFDERTFTEVGAYARPRYAGSAMTADVFEGVVTGFGAVDGRLVYAWVQDYSRQSGAFNEACVRKVAALYELAEKNGAPVVAVFDSAGLKIEEGIDAVNGYGVVAKCSAALSGAVPQISVICGICSGGAAVAASMGDFVFMEKKNGRLYMNPPFILKNSIGDKVETDFGTAESCEKIGLCTSSADGEAALFADVRALLAYLPSNSGEEGAIVDTDDDYNRLTDKLGAFVQGDYDIREVITQIADDGKFLELNKNYAGNMVCGFAGVAGIAVGIVANQPSCGGRICPGAAEKAAKLIAFCDSFGMPVLTFADSEGMNESVAAEEAQFPLYAARLAGAYAGASTAMITLIVGKAYGSACMLMGSKSLGADLVLAFPTSSVSILPPETAVDFLMSDEIKKADDPASERARLIEEWEIEKSSPAAQSAIIDVVIKPEQTRQRIASALFSLQNKNNY